MVNKNEISPLPPAIAAMRHIDASVVTVRPPMFPNFIKIEARDGGQMTMRVGALSDAEAESLWNRWKEAWVKHVADARQRLNEIP